MSQRKILTQLQLKKNHKGTFCADIKVEGQDLSAFLSNKVIEGGKLYTDPIEGSQYWASINLTKIGPFINQLLPLAKNESQSSKIQYHGYCQLLEDGLIRLSHEATQNEDSRDITLPKAMLFNFAYRIFHNSQVVVTFGHNNSGFFIKEWQTEYPNDIDKGIAINIRKEIDYYLADYYIAKDIYLPVKIESYLLKYEGIYDINEKACINATLTLDDQQKKANISLILDHQALVNKYNQPKAKLTFIGIKEREGSDLYQFETMLIDGISLLVAIFSYELKFMAEDIVSFQKGQSVSTFLTYKISGKWCNFKIPVAAKNEFNEQFRCITTTSVDNEGMALLETSKPPHDRVLLPRSELIKQGVYEVYSGVGFDLHITREALDKPWKEKLWLIKDIDKKLFIGIDSDKAYEADCSVVKTWSRYDNRPEYLVKLDRKEKNKNEDDIYAFTNHGIAKVSSDYADLLLIIPKPLLIESNFRTLAPNDKLCVVFKNIVFPIFEAKAVRILCADRLLSHELSKCSVDASTCVFADFVEELPQFQSKDRYRFAIVGSEDTASFIDNNNCLRQIPNLDKYRYKIRIERFKEYLNVKELISASIK